MLNERVRFVMACREGDASMSALCAQFGVSRRPGVRGPIGPVADRSSVIWPPTVSCFDSSSAVPDEGY